MAKMNKVEIPPVDKCSVVISTWVSEKLCGKLRSMANEQNLPLSTYIRKALEEYVRTVEDYK